MTSSSDGASPIISGTSSSSSVVADGVGPNSTGSVPAGAVDSTTTVRSLEELRTLAPEVWSKMEQGVALNIVNKMKRAQKKLKEIRQEYNR